MAHTFVSLDFYNENLSCRINGNSYLFSSVERFNSTGFPFSNTVKILSYEPDRKLYVVEDSNGNVTNDVNSEVIQWIHNNLNVIEQTALREYESNHPKTSAADQRTILLFNTDYVLQRHQEETALNMTHTLSDEQFNNVLVYRQALRDLNVHGVVEGTTRTKTIDDVTWPANPLT